MAEADVVFEFKGDAKDFQSTIKAINKSLKQTDDNVKKTGKETDEALGKKAPKASNNFAKALGGVTIASAVAAKAIQVVSKHVGELVGEMDRIAKAADNIGASTDQVQVLERTFGRMVEAPVDVTQVMTDLQKAIAATADEGSKASKTFDDLGINVDRFRQLDPTEQIAAIADGLQNLDDQADRTAATQVLLGRSSRELGAALKEGGEAVRTNAEAVRGIGLANAEAINNAEEFSDALGDIEQALFVLQTEALEPLLPLLTDTAQEIQAIISEAAESGSINDLGDALLRIADSGVLDIFVGVFDIMSKLGPVVDALSFILERMWILPVSAIETFVQLLKGDTQEALLTIANLADTLAFGLTDWVSVVDDAAEAQGKLNDELEETEEIISRVGFFGIDQLEQTQEIRDKLIRTLRQQKFAQKALNEEQKKGETLTFGIPETAEVLEAMDLIIAKAKDVGKTFEFDVAIAMSELVGQAAQDGVDQVNEQMAQLEADMQATAGAIGDIFGSINDLFTMIQEDRVDAVEETSNRIAQIDEKLQGELSASERKRLEAEKKTEEEKLQNQKQAALVAFGIAKAAALAEAAVSLALGIVNSLAVGGAAGIALAAATGIAGGIAIGAIAAEPPPSFHTGGMTQDERLVIRSGEEAGILSPIGVGAAGGKEGVDQLNRGIGNNSVITTVFRVGNRTTDAQMTENLRTKRGPLSERFRTVQPTRVERVGHYAPGR